MAQALALPELGYVTKPLNVIIYEMRCTYGNIKNFSGLNEFLISKTVWVGLTKGFPKEFIDYYPFGPKDKLVKKIIIGGHEAVLFTGGFQIEAVRQKLEDLNKMLAMRGQSRLNKE